MRWPWFRTRPLLSNRTTRNTPRRAPSRRFVPRFDLLEDRVTPSLFLQGNVVNDVTQAPLAGATITLEDSTGNPILNNGTPITVVSDANGNYTFDASNTFGKLTAGTTYRLMETPPPGFANHSTIIAPNQFDPASQVNAQTIQVALTDPSKVHITFDFNQYVAEGREEPIQFQLRESDNLFHTIAGSVGNIPVTISGLPGGGSIFIQTLCVNVLQDLQVGVNDYMAIPEPFAPFTDNQPVFNSGRIAYLYNHFGSTLNVDADHAVAVQLAVFKLLYDPTPDPNDLNVGNLDYNQSPLLAALAGQLIAQSNARNEHAVFLNAIAPPLQGGLQSVMATSNLVFGNIPQPSIVTVASAPTFVGSGVPLNDTATLSGGINPGGTITFRLFDPNGALAYTDIVTANGNGNYNTSVGTNPGGFLPSVPGTYNWLATYSGDLNNTPASSRFGDEPVAVGTLSKRFFLANVGGGAAGIPGLPAGAMFGAIRQVTDPLPTFTWAPISGADHYDLWIDDNTTGQSQVVRNQNLLNSTFTPTVPFIVGHTYTWWVRGIAANGTPGAWSAGQTFSEIALPAPVPITPAGETNELASIYTWQPVIGADHYDLWVDDLTTGQQQVLRVQNVVGPGFASPAPSRVVGHTYEWWVRAVNVVGTPGSWSSGTIFTEVTVGTAKPLGPKVTGLKNATFYWTSAVGANDYDVWVDDVTTGQQQVLRFKSTAGITSIAAPGPLTLGDHYRWWVRGAAGPANNQTFGPWSAAADFTVVNFPAPSLLQATGPGGIPAFTWTAVTGANHYDLWVDDLTTGQSQVVRAMNVAATFYSPPPLSHGHTYRVWVRAFDNFGASSPWSAALDFTVA